MMYLQDRMKNRWKMTLVLCGLLIIALLIFIKLYVDETNEVQRRYSAVFSTKLTEAHDILKDYSQDTFDASAQYTIAVTQLGVAREMLFLIQTDESKQISMNEIYFAFLKYPQQMTVHAPAVANALSQINSEEEGGGYDALDGIISQIDRLGH